MNLYEIKKRLENTNLPVFTTRDIARFANLEYKQAIVYISRMVEKDILKHISKGVYALDDDPFAVASFLFPNSYISFNSALYIHKVINQVPFEVQVVTPVRTNRKLQGISFVCFPKEKIFGFGKIRYKNTWIYVADLEKAIVDIVYKNKHIDLDLIEKADSKKLQEYARKMGDSVVRRLKV